MVFQLFTSILASIVAFFGAIVPLNDDVKHWFADITVGKTLEQGGDLSGSTMQALMIYVKDAEAFVRSGSVG